MEGQAETWRRHPLGNRTSLTALRVRISLPPPRSVPLNWSAAGLENRRRCHSRGFESSTLRQLTVYSTVVPELSTVQKGRIAEAATVLALVEQGYEPYVPTFGNGPCDMMTVVNGRPVRIEVKYCARPVGAAGAYEVSLRQVRANRREMVVKKFNAGQCDVLAVYLAPAEIVLFFPAAVLHDRVSIRVRADMETERESLAEAVGG